MQICGEITTSLQSLPIQNYKPHEFDFDILNIVLTDEQESILHNDG